MKLLNRYILRQIAGPVLLAIVVIMVLGAANEIQERVRELPLAQMTLRDMSRVTAYYMPGVLPFVVPITFLLGILFAFGHMAQNNEIVSMKAAGIPLKRIVVPVIAAGVLLSIANFLIQDRIQPWAMQRVNALVYDELPLRMTLDALPKGVMQDYGGWRIYVGRQNPGTGELEDIVILEPKEKDMATTYYAASAQVLKEDGQTVLEMKDVHFIPPGESGYVTRLAAPSVRLALPPLEAITAHPERASMSLEELWTRHGDLERELEAAESDPTKAALYGLRSEIAERLALPFACLAVAFVAAPLGARAQRAGRSYTFAMGLSITVAYYVLKMAMTPRDFRPIEEFVLCAWTPNLLLIAAGVVLVWRVDHV